jgi:hypothetical protein
MKKLDSIEHVWSIICSRSIIDSETNSLTLNNVIEKITVNIPKVEFEKAKGTGHTIFNAPIEYEITSLFRKSEGKKVTLFDMRVRMVNSSGQTIMTGAEQKIGLKEGVKNIRIRNRFNAIPLEKTGGYTFIIDLKEIEETVYAEVGRIPVEIEMKIM